MRTIRKKLTEEDVERGVVFTSTLSKGRNEMVGDTTHEVFKTDEDRDRQIERLEDARAFKHSPWNFNIIRTR